MAKKSKLPPKPPPSGRKPAQMPQVAPNQWDEMFPPVTTDPEPSGLAPEQIGAIRRARRLAERLTHEIDLLLRSDNPALVDRVNRVWSAANGWDMDTLVRRGIIGVIKIAAARTEPADPAERAAMAHRALGVWYPEAAAKLERAVLQAAIEEWPRGARWKAVNRACVSAGLPSIALASIASQWRKVRAGGDL